MPDSPAMPDNPVVPDSPAMPDLDLPTGRLPAVMAPSDAASGSLDALAPDDLEALHLDDQDDIWQTGPQKPGLRLRIPTAVLVVLIAVAGGFWAGAAAEKHHSPSSTSALSSVARQFAAARAAGGATGGGSGGAGGFGAGGAVTTGIVTAVKGQVLYLTNASGNLIQVTLGQNGTVSRTLASGVAGLQTGETVVVRGAAGSDGTVTATSIIATPQSAAGTPAGG